MLKGRNRSKHLLALLLTALLILQNCIGIFAESDAASSETLAEETVEVMSESEETTETTIWEEIVEETPSETDEISEEISLPEDVFETENEEETELPESETEVSDAEATESENEEAEIPTTETEAPDAETEVPDTETEAPVVEPEIETPEEENLPEKEFSSQTPALNIGPDEDYPDYAFLKEISPWEGTGELGLVHSGSEITYEITYKNKKDEPEDLIFIGYPDEFTTFVSADHDGVYYADDNEVRWTINSVPAHEEVSVRYTVKVREDIENGSTLFVEAYVESSPKHGVYLAPIRQRVTTLSPEKVHMVELFPLGPTQTSGISNVGQIIWYEISFMNTLPETTDITIKFPLDANVTFWEDEAAASEAGAQYRNYQEATHTVIWNIPDVPAGKESTVLLKVRPEEGALTAGSISHTAYVQLGNATPEATETITNIFPERPKFREVSPYTGTGELGKVQPGQEIVYELTVKNYKDTTENIKIRVRNFDNLAFVSADHGAVYDEESLDLDWLLENVAPQEEITVSFKVKVDEEMIISANVEMSADVYVGSDDAIWSNSVINVIDGYEDMNDPVTPTPEPATPTPVPKEPTKAPTKAPSKAPSKSPETTASKVPNTGDDTPIALYAALLLAAAGTAGVVLKKRSKK